MNWFFKKLGIEKRIRKKERLLIAEEIEEVRSWLFGSDGDLIRKENPQMAKALRLILHELIFTAQIDPHKFRNTLLEEIKGEREVNDV